MNKLRETILIFLFVFVVQQVSFSQSINIYERPKRTERSHDYDAIHYRIKLRFDEESKSFWGENRITLTPLKNDFKTCTLDAETFTVTSVQNSAGNNLQFEQKPGELAVHFLEAYQFEDTLTFTVYYQAENVDIDPQKYGMSKGYDLGIDFKDETINNPQLINTLSFPEGARHWFPCYDHPNDRATNEVIVTVRDDYKVLSNGKLVSETEDNFKKTKTVHWSQEMPHPTYLFVLVAGPYEVLKDSLGSLPINYWIYKKDGADARRSFYKTPQIIEFFNNLYGYDYPWVKYDQITIPGIGGGAESTTATVLGQSTIHDEQADKDFSSHWLIAHEAAHQWWGNLVSYRDWSEIWLSESFATFSEYLFARHDLGEDEGALNLEQKKNSYLNEAHSRYIRPIVFDRWRYPNDNFDRHTYQKGATVLNMLRFVLGEDLFFKSLSHFLHKHAFRPVDTHDLKTAIKEATGQNMDWFFEQWIYSPGHPKFEVSYAWDATDKFVRIRIEQIQDTATGVPVFKMPVVLGVVTEDGKRSERVWLNNKIEEFDIPSAKFPLMVRFDEGNNLLKEWTFTKTVDELLYQLKNDDAIGRKWAVAELSKFQVETRVISALKIAAKNDPFWAVRRSATTVLGEMTNDDFLDFFKQQTKDNNSKVRAAALNVLGNFRRMDLVKFFQDRYEKDDSYVAQAAALKAIGSCGDTKSLDFLNTKIDILSPRNIIQRAAERAIVAIRRRM